MNIYLRFSNKLRSFTMGFQVGSHFGRPRRFDIEELEKAKEIMDFTRKPKVSGKGLRIIR